MTLGMPISETDALQIAANFQAKMDMDVNAMGDDVRITFPNFSNFEEVTVPEIAA